MSRVALAALLACACGARSGLAFEDAAPPAPETCNAIDDDGDGRVDEDLPPEGCGVGACAREAPGCVDGEVPTCEPGEPAPEICNGVDDDCNGLVDDGVSTPCGGCSADCGQQCVGIGCDSPLEPGPGTEVTAQGALVTGGAADVMPRAIWLVSGSDHSVTRVDTQTLETLGRYWSGPPADTDYTSSVAVDGEGNGFLLSAGHQFSEATLTRIQASECTDVNGDGTVETSSSDDPLDWGQDDCVSWNVTAVECQGGNGCSGLGGVAVTDRGAHVWVAVYGQSMVELDAQTGEPTGRTADVDGGVAALLADGRGNLWVTSWTAELDRIPLDAPQDVEVLNPGPSYINGLDLTEDGRLAMISPLGVYDYESDDLETTAWTAWGLAVTADGEIWGSGGDGTLRRYDPDSLDHDSFRVAGTPYSLAGDLEGNLWTVDAGAGTATVYDADGQQIDTILDDCSHGFGGSGCLQNPSLAGDPTGLRYRRAYGSGGQGETRHVFDGTVCEANHLDWGDISWDTAGGDIAFSLRTADAPEDLAVAPWIPLGQTPPEDGATSVDAVFAAHGAATGSYLEVRAQLRGSDAELDRLGVDYVCDDLLQ
jgi:putative metal-binding protein